MQVEKIIIEGETEHNVGYRPFLLEKAWEFNIPNYHVRNVEEGGKQRVAISLGGDESQVNEFMEFVKENYPPQASVLKVWEDPNPPRRVMSIKNYSQLLNAEQQNTVVQTGLKMLGKQDQMIDKQDETIEEIKTVGNKVDRGFTKTDQDFSALRGDYGRISQTMEGLLESMDNTSRKTEQVLERLTQQQEGFTQAITGLTEAILKLAEKSAR